MPKEPEKTNEEIYRERAIEGEKERLRREQYGPKHIVVAGQTAAEKVSDAAGQNSTSGSLSRATGRARSISREKTGEERRVTGTDSDSRQPADTGEFGEMPGQSMLQPAGHAKIDCAVRFAMKGNGYYDIMSSYGTLRITPISSGVIRICFAKGQCNQFPAPIRGIGGDGGRYKIKEAISTLELMTDKVMIRVEKRTGAVSFLDARGNELLKERSQKPRQIGEGQVWEFFDWSKKETLIAKGLEPGQLLQIGNSAKYISYGADSGELPAIASTKGYELIFPPKRKTLCCNIPVYGPYVSQEGSIIDFYFRISGT